MIVAYTNIPQQNRVNRRNNANKCEKGGRFRSVPLCETGKALGSKSPQMKQNSLRAVMHAFNPITSEVDAGGSLCV